MSMALDRATSANGRTHSVEMEMVSPYLAEAQASQSPVDGVRDVEVSEEGSGAWTSD